MRDEWQQDEGVIQAIDDCLMTMAVHVDDVLSRLFQYKSLPTPEPDIILFGVIGPYIMNYNQSRINGEPPSDAHHRGMAAVLGDPAIAAVLQSMASRGMDAVVRRQNDDF